MPTTTVRAHARAGSRGVRSHPRRYLTEMDIERGRGGGVGRAALSSELIAQGLAEGYAAAGPWEVERVGNTATLMHYAFPIAKARFSPAGGWEVRDVQGRPGYGMSATDRAGVRLFSGALASHWQIEVPPVGKNPDVRLQGVRGMGSRVSPYAVVVPNPYRESLGLSPGYRLGPSFPARRGRRET